MGIGERIRKDDDNKIAILKEGKKNKIESIVFVAEEPQYSLNDIILPQDIKEKILDIAEYAENSKIVFEDWGLQKTHRQSKRVGINLYGDPGTGKTMAAHAIARYLNRKIVIVNYADIESKYVGETPKNICKAFDFAKETKSILFFDEADAILSKRVKNMSSATDVSVNQTRSVLLMLLNEYQDFIIFATNFIENFDPAFMRRISMHVRFKLPDKKCRELLWRKYTPDTMPHNIDFEEISEKYDGISGSDISNAILTAAFKVARRKGNCVEKKYIFEAIEDIINSKRANDNNEDIKKKKVSEEYVYEQIEKIKKKEDEKQ